MKSYTIQLHRKRHTVLADTPRRALWLAVKAHAIPSSAWNWIKDNKAEGFYGPLSIVQNHASQMVLPLTTVKEF